MNEKELREVRRRFKPEKSNISGIRGCFVGETGEIVSQFYQPMSQCSEAETSKLLSIMKKSLSGSLGSNLTDIVFTTSQVAQSTEHSRLMALRNSALKDENAVNEFFKLTTESLHIDGSYVILLACDNYDIFTYTSDGEKSESTDVYSYIVCSICPIKQLPFALSYQDCDQPLHSIGAASILGSPELGFLFPAFDDRAANIYGALFYTRDISKTYENFVESIFNVPPKMPAPIQQEAFNSCLCEALGNECDLETVSSVHEQIGELIEEHKESKDPEPLRLSKSSLSSVLESCGVEAEKIESFAENYSQNFGDDAELCPKNIVNTKQFNLSLPDVTIKVNPERRELVQTQIINGVKYILIRATEGVELNGVNININ